MIKQYYRKPQTKAAIDISLSTIFWGLSFPLAKICLEFLPPAQMGFFRALFTFILGEILFLIWKWKEYPGTSPWKETFFPGLFLAGVVITNNFCLKFATSTMASFLTCLYVVEVAAINKIFFKFHISNGFYLCILGALLGISILTGIQDSNDLPGIIFGIIASIASACQILYMTRVAEKVTNIFRFNNFQQLWAAIILAPFALFEKSNILSLKFEIRFVSSFLTLCLFVGLFAFSLQIRGQKIISSHLASILFLLESPFAGGPVANSVFGWRPDNLFLFFCNSM